MRRIIQPPMWLELAAAYLFMVGAAWLLHRPPTDYGLADGPNTAVPMPNMTDLPGFVAALKCPETRLLPNGSEECGMWISGIWRGGVAMEHLARFVMFGYTASELSFVGLDQDYKFSKYRTAMAAARALAWEKLVTDKDIGTPDLWQFLRDRPGLFNSYILTSEDRVQLYLPLGPSHMLLPAETSMDYYKSVNTRRGWGYLTSGVVYALYTAYQIEGVDLDYDKVRLIDWRTGAHNLHSTYAVVVVIAAFVPIVVVLILQARARLPDMAASVGERDWHHFVYALVVAAVIGAPWAILASSLYRAAFAFAGAGLTGFCAVRIFPHIRLAVAGLIVAPLVIQSVTSVYSIAAIFSPVMFILWPCSLQLVPMSLTALIAVASWLVLGSPEKPPKPIPWRFNGRTWIIGPNGMGKSTLARRYFSKRVAVCPQAEISRLYTTVGDTFDMFWRVRRVNATRDLPTRLGLDRSTKVKHLSGGQRQLLKVACALAGGHAHLIADEIFKGMDQANMDKVLAAIAKLDCVLVEHDLSLIGDKDNIIMVVAKDTHIEGVAVDLIEKHGSLCSAVKAEFDRHNTTRPIAQGRWWALDFNGKVYVQVWLLAVAVTIVVHFVITNVGSDAHEMAIRIPACVEDTQEWFVANRTLFFSGDTANSVFVAMDEHARSRGYSKRLYAVINGGKGTRSLKITKEALSAGLLCAFTILFAHVLFMDRLFTWSQLVRLTPKPWLLPRESVYVAVYTGTAVLVALMLARAFDSDVYVPGFLQHFLRDALCLALVAQVPYNKMAVLSVILFVCVVLTIKWQVSTTWMPYLGTIVALQDSIIGTRPDTAGVLLVAFLQAVGLVSVAVEITRRARRHRHASDVPVIVNSPNATFTADTGTPTTLVGANGCGKSTLLTAIYNSTLRPTLSSPAISASVPCVLYLRQSVQPIGCTVSRYVGYLQALWGNTTNVVALCPSPINPKQNIDTLSEGEYRQLMAAVALLVPPGSVVLADEPMAGADEYSDFVVECIRKIAQACTVVWVKHGEVPCDMQEGVVSVGMCSTV